MSKVDLLNYEVTSSWWAGWISNDRLQVIVAKYFAAKVNRKYRQWQEHEQWKRRIAFLAAAQLKDRSK